MALGEAGEAYIKWAAKLAVGLNTGVPWIMCKEDDAPDPIVSNLYPTVSACVGAIILCEKLR